MFTDGILSLADVRSCQDWFVRTENLMPMVQQCPGIRCLAVGESWSIFRYAAKQAFCCRLNQPSKTGRLRTHGHEEFQHRPSLQRACSHQSLTGSISESSSLSTKKACATGLGLFRGAQLCWREATAPVCIVRASVDDARYGDKASGLRGCLELSSFLLLAHHQAISRGGIHSASRLSIASAKGCFRT